MKDKLDILSRVTKTEAPSFLYTRILQRIEAVQQAPVSVKFKFAFTAIAAAILLLNALVFIRNPQSSAPEPGNTVTTPYSSTINNIYYE